MTPEQPHQIDQARRYAEQDDYAITRMHIRNLLAIIEQQAANVPEVKDVITTEVARRLLEGGEKSLHGVLISDYISGAEPAQPQQAASVPDFGVTGVDRGFTWCGEKQQHTPTLTITFTPVPANQPNTEKGWKDRDALAAFLLAAAPEGPKS